MECLHDRYDRPRLIHQAHVRKILEVPSLKDSSGKELRKFHDTMKQHVRALKTMGHEPPGSFLTSLSLMSTLPLSGRNIVCLRQGSLPTKIY